MKFGDKYEIVLNNVSIHSDYTNTLEIQMMNKKSNMSPVFRLENSEFPGIDELTDTAKRFIYLNFENIQKEMDEEDENCNFDYKGVINITSNKFEYLGYQVSKHTIQPYSTLLPTHKHFYTETLCKIMRIKFCKIHI